MECMKPVLLWCSVLEWARCLIGRGRERTYIAIEMTLQHALQTKKTVGVKFIGLTLREQHGASSIHTLCT